jgi:hypothetical protein
MRWIIVLLALLAIAPDAVLADPNGRSSPVQEPCCGDGK